MPVLDGKFRSSSMAASNPPAEPPIPTIGHLEFCLADLDPDVALVEFDCDDFVPPVFTRVEEALVVAFRFAAMALFMLVAAYAAHKLRLGFSAPPVAGDP
jgi:hypothetical protein